MKLNIYFNFIILCILFQSVGGVFGKYAALDLSSPASKGVITNPFYIMSLFCLLLQAIFWQQALKYYPLSFAYPFMGLVNFVILFSSAFLFGESITSANIIGLIIISIGITMLSRTSSDFA